MKKAFTILALLAMLVAVVPTSAKSGPQPLPAAELQRILAAKGEQTFIVQMIDAPVVAYEGDIAGLAATKPEKGKKIDPNSAKVKKYVDHLKGSHDAALSAVGGKKLYDYTYSFNGFAAKLTPAQAEALKSEAGVVFIWADELRQPTTENSPSFLGLTAEGGLWDMGISGEDVIIGVIDTGIWPEHPSFSDRTGTNPRGKPGKLDYHQIPGWHGKCVPGEAFNASHCNQKLIGAQYFVNGFGVENITDDYISARDHDGHGTHTASTAGGNAGVPATLLGVDRGVISGIAPRARISAYKACWDDSGCMSSDLVAAIDQAVADGVDVINYSIGGSSTSVITSDAIAFLFAADAGVMVATSAGNSGPGASTLGNPGVAPWLTTVGASTQNRTFQGSASSSDGWEFFGSSVTAGSDELPLVDAANAGSELCIPGELDPSLVEGNIVLCKRGAIARVDKSLAVYLAGGAGMILYNANDAQSQDTDNHWVPSVHINNTDGMVIKAYIAADPDPTAMINGGAFTPIPAPWMADFSSRGPNAGAPDIIKPDITAPGVNILAGNSPTAYLGYPGQLFMSIGGTSMSSPHIAGIFALLKEAHPDWSPAMAKSAIMTSAYQDVMKEDGLNPADPFDMGGGHVDPNQAVDPGLVYDAGWYDYLGFLCGVAPQIFANPAATCAFLESIGVPTDPSDLNYPSIGVAGLAGSQTVVRTVTSVTGVPATYTVAVEAPAGIEVVVDPAELTLNPGESASFEVTFTASEAAVLDEWAFGALTWSHGPHHVRSPLAVKPVALAAPAEVIGSGTEGSLEFDVQFGFTGDYTAGVHGLAPADMVAGNVLDDQANDWNTALSCFLGSGGDPACGVTLHFVDVPAGSAFARFSLFDDYTDGEDDLDLYVYHPDGHFAGGSGSGTSAEQVDVLLPMEGAYYVFVHGWQTDGADSNYTLFDWIFGLVDDRGNMTVSAPNSVTLGAIETITVDWTGLEPDKMYLGAVSHSNSGGLLGLTLVNIDTGP